MTSKRFITVLSVAMGLGMTGCGDQLVEDEASPPPTVTQHIAAWGGILSTGTLSPGASLSPIFLADYHVGDHKFKIWTTPYSHIDSSPPVAEVRFSWWDSSGGPPANWQWWYTQYETVELDPDSGSFPRVVNMNSGSASIQYKIEIRNPNSVKAIYYWSTCTPPGCY